MSVDKFIQVLERNFKDNQKVHLAENKKWVEHEGQDFVPLVLGTDKIKGYLGMRMKHSDKVGDFYVCFTPCEGSRKKENAQDSFVLAMDIDGAKIPTDFPPSYYWETSLNKHQGIWLLDNPVTPKEQEELNRKMVIKYGFDPCSNDIVHLYRIPNTINHKYGKPFNISGLKGDGTVYRKRDIMKALDEVKSVTISVTDTEPIDFDFTLDLDQIIEEYSLSTYFYQLAGADRSRWSWDIGAKMVRQSATKEEVKLILLSAPKGMRKFDEKTVDAEVHRIFAKVEEEDNGDYVDEDGHEKRPKIAKEGAEQSSISRLRVKNKRKNTGVSIKKVSEIEDYDDTDMWLVEGLWANESVGIIGAPSKSFKSTLTTNLACAIATGRDFDGRKVKQGTVLILQGENNLSIEKQKIYAITGDEDVSIYYVEDNLNLDTIMKLRKFIIDEQVRLLIIDPLYLLFGNGDINKHTDITNKLSQLSRLRDETGCSVMLVHHSRKLERGSKITTNDMYGSAFIEGWYESMILLQRNGVNTSRMTTYFRNHRSGDKYTLLVDDNMGCTVIPDKADEDEFQVNFSSIKTNEGED